MTGPHPEAFWHLRQHFAASLAATSGASYILGIGDRHLDNYLLCQRTGEVVPIDFGYSFGIGAQIPVPELTPFRLTGFLTSVFQPLSGPLAHGTFRDGLISVLSRCRERRGILQDACAVFLLEPLMDWAEQARKRGDADINLRPRRRLRLLSDRLWGRHPAAVLCDEIGDSPMVLL